MAFLAPNVNLEDLWEQRSQLPDYKMRDEAYRAYENAYLSRTSDGERQNVTWRPVMLDGQVGDTRGREPINLAKQFGLHHTAAAAAPPRVWNEAGTLETEETSLKNTAMIQVDLRYSRIKLLQTQQASHLAMLGDAAYGIAWDTKLKRAWVKIVKPSYCYPGLDDTATGNLKDMLITYQLHRGWAEMQYGIKIPENKSTVRLYEYWDDEWRIVQIEKVKVDDMRLQHRLGFVPWYWCFNQVPGLLAQADIAETPKLQGITNEMLILGQDAVRKVIDKAYFAVGHKGTVEPKAGKVIGFPNPNTKIDEFPTAAPPDMIMGFMQFIQQHAQSMAGISPISMEGMAQGSIVTGSAVRHQVEAIEARAQAKRTQIETAYAWIGESLLKVHAQKLPNYEMRLRLGSQETTHSGSEVGDWTQCEASYGSFEGLATMERGQWAMQGLGRVHGRRTAIALAYPERDVESMEREIDSYQLQQAELSAQAQAAAQGVLQSGGGPGAGAVAGGAPGGQSSVVSPGPQLPLIQAQQRPPEPGGMTSIPGAIINLADLELLLKLAQGRLRGDAYAVGEMAIVGMSSAPEVVVTNSDDRPLVQAVLAPKRVMVTDRELDEREPRVQLNAR